MDQSPFLDPPKQDKAEMLKHDLLMDALDLNSDGGSNMLNPNFLEAIPESDNQSNLLQSENGDFVKDQI